MDAVGETLEENVVVVLGKAVSEALAVAAAAGSKTATSTTTHCTIIWQTVSRTDAIIRDS